MQVRVFVSSPGDMGNERAIARRVLDQMRGAFSGRMQIDAYFWEDEPVLATLGFQEQIPDPADFDVVVCMFWSRLGTPLPREQLARKDGSPYESGTVYEYERSVESFRDKRVPHVLVYHKTTLPDFSKAPTPADALKLAESWQSVFDYIERNFLKQGPDGHKEFVAAFRTVKDEHDFERLLRLHLRKELDDWHERNKPPESAAAPLWDIAVKGSPFRGLAAFDYEHAAVFVGRTRAISEVKRLLERQAALGRAFALVLGMSGGGKSSLVRAGFLPPLVNEAGFIQGIGLWRFCVFRPGDGGDPLEALAAALLGRTALPELTGCSDSSGQNIDPLRLAAILRDRPGECAAIVPQALGRVAGALARQLSLETVPAARLAVVVDQFEELFTRPGTAPEQRERFVAALSVLARSGAVWVIATMRSDLYARCAEIPELVALKEGGQYDLLPPGASELKDIVELPAQAAGLVMEGACDSEPSLADRLVAAAGDARSLPLLEFTLEELFVRREGNKLTHAQYDAIGGLHGALVNRAEAVWAALKPEIRARFEPVMRELVTLREGAVEVLAAARVPYNNLTADPQQKALVDAFVEARLFVTDRADDGTPVVQIVHEALLAHWPRLTEFLAHSREFLRTRTRAEAAAQRWLSEKKSDDYLLHPGKPLVEGQDLLAHHRSALTHDVVDFLTRSVQKDEAERNRRSMARFAATAAFVLVAGIFGIVSFVQKRAAQKARDVAVQKEAEANTEKDRAERSLGLTRVNLAERNWRTNDVGRARQLLDETPDEYRQWEWRYVRRLCESDRLTIAVGQPVRMIAWDPTGSRLVAGFDKPRALPTPRTIAAPPAAIPAKSLLDRARELVGSAAAPSGAQMPQVELFDFAMPALSRIDPFNPPAALATFDAATGLRGQTYDTNLTHLAGLSFAAGSPNAPRVAVVSSTMQRETAGGASNALLGRNSLFAAPVYALTGMVWDPQQTGAIASRVVTGTAGTISPDGRRLAFAHASLLNRNTWGMQISVTDLAAPDTDPHALHLSAADVTQMTFDPSSQRLAWVESPHRSLMKNRLLTPAAGPVVKWKALARPGELRSIPAGGEVSRIAFSPDGKLLALAGTFSGDHGIDIRICDTSTETTKTLATGLPHLGGLAFDATSRRLAAALDDQTARLWDIASSRELRTFRGHSSWLTCVAFHPSEQVLASGGNDGTIRLWQVDRADPQVCVFSGLSRPIEALAVHPQQALVAALSKGNLISLWNGDAPVDGFAPDRADAANRRPQRTFGGAKFVAISPDGRLLATAGLGDEGSREVWLYDLDGNADELRRCVGHTSAIQAAAFHPNGKELVTIDGEGTGFFWSLPTGARQRRTISSKNTGIRVAAYSPDGSTIAAGGTGNDLPLWTGDGETPTKVLSVPNLSLSTLRFDPDGKRLAAFVGFGFDSDPSRVVVWNLPDGGQAPPQNIAAGTRHHTAFSPDLKRLFSASAEKGVQVWDTQTGMETLGLTGSGLNISALALSPDGHRLAVGSDDGTIRLWDASPVRVMNPQRGK